MNDSIAGVLAIAGSVSLLFCLFADPNEVPRGRTGLVAGFLISAVVAFVMGHVTVTVR
jgi:hypothetical protein